MYGPSRPPCDRGVVQAAPPPSPAEAALSPGRKRLVLGASVLGSSLAFIDSSVVGVALPQIQRDLAAGAAGAQWIVNAYLLVLGAFVLIGGAAGDRFGRRRVFLIGIGIFAVASAACGLAPSSGLLIAARALQGFGAALLTPASLALLGAAFPENERGRAFGAWAGFASLTSALGPPLGGWLTDAISWRAVFLINLPVAAVAVLLTLRFVPESRDPEAGRLDLLGAGLAAGGLGALTWGLTAAPDRGFGDPVVRAALAGGVLLFAGFLLAEARERQPMMPLALYRSRAFSATNLLTLLLYFALGGAMFFLPYDLIRSSGYSATQAGAALLPFSAVMGVFSPLAGRLGDRIGPRLQLTVGPIVAGVGLVLIGLVEPGAPYLTRLLPALLVMAVGVTTAVAPLTATVMGAVEPRHAGLASGVNNAVARVAGLLAVAVLGIVLSVSFTRAVAARGGDPAKARAELSAVMAGQAQGASGSMDEFHVAIRTVMFVAGGCAAAGGLVAFVALAGVRPRQSAA
ncbi:DHA2 family efflux MFS transporter permease subunit [Caulobacter sp. 17J80-11]|uniref:DHA2 family efflux MFS transporter permease subunit n=1 Tax=Caulobacter sp. 17J80-11 TaxID=2763502 RepID=UPI0016539273|nr:DHA2 family efflux MFS transporter permease subunit [Caulobacter sp. 17J80-11]MBC6981591.1 DHA2 family efflux MFS transporter permease subunit [Caulobacter sp. 17J80-11]